MSRYHVTLTEAEVKDALREWLEVHRYPVTTVGNVVYFSHDLMTGDTLVELSLPLPLDDGYPHGAEEYDYEKHEEDVEGSPV